MDRTVLERKLHKKGRTPDMDGRLTLWDRRITNPSKESSERKRKILQRSSIHTFPRNGSPFFPQKTRSGITPKGVFRYKSHSKANADMEKWISESIQRFEIAKARSINFHDLVIDQVKDSE